MANYVLLLESGSGTLLESGSYLDLEAPSITPPPVASASVPPPFKPLMGVAPIAITLGGN